MNMDRGAKIIIMLIGLIISIPLLYFLIKKGAKALDKLLKKISPLNFILIFTLIAFLIFDGFYLFHKIELLWKWEIITLGIINGVLLILLAMAARIIFNIGFTHFLVFLERIYKHFTKYKR
jgi:hypothetical protein